VIVNRSEAFVGAEPLLTVKVSTRPDPTPTQTRCQCNFSKRKFSVLAKTLVSTLSLVDEDRQRK
jgi:hypothetical protein